MQSLNPATRGPVPQHTPSADDVRAELELILSSPHLQASKRRRAFLRFIVEETLSGRADRLKGYTVAVAVFDRDETFDPRADPVVRLEARRLRRDLDSYYVDAGSHDVVRISIPKGSYVPRFEWHEGTPPATAPGGEQTARSDARSDAPPDTSPSLPGESLSKGVSGVFDAIRAPPRNMLIAALVASVVAVAVIGWVLTAGREGSASGDPMRGPTVVVLPFEALGSTENSHYLASGISLELIGNLMRFPGFQLYTLPISFEKDTSPMPVELGRDLGVTYVVSGSVRDEAETIRVAAQLFDAVTGLVLWTESYDRPLTPEALIRVQSDLAGEIATVLGQPYGVVNHDLNVRLATPVVSSMRSYVCVLRVHGYRRSISREEFDPVLGCLEEAVQRDPDYSDAWAMLGWLYLDAGRFNFAGNGKPHDHYDKALQAASRAIQLEPNNTLAIKALSAINHYQGNYSEGERFARLALERNPHDPDTLIQLGWRLAARGDFEEGVPLIERAIARSVNPPGWYYHSLAIARLMNGDAAGMLGVAERATVAGPAKSQSLDAMAPALSAMAHGLLGNEEAARRALTEMNEISPGYDPIARLRRHQATDEIIETVTTALHRAGWPDAIQTPTR